LLSYKETGKMVVTLQEDGKEGQVIFDSTKEGRISPSNVDNLIKKLRESS
jgi:hypothetical protein